MPQTKKSAPVSSRSDEIQHQIQALSGRDIQLWSIMVLIVVVMAAGFLAMVFPNMSWHSGIRIEDRYLPQFFFGFIVLVVLFNVYVISQKHTMNTTRLELLRELVINEKLDGLSLIDPVTQLLSRESMELVVSREASRANRLGSSLAYLVVGVDSLNNVRTRFGRPAGEKMLGEAAHLVKDTFRGSDTVLRYTESEFLVVMPDTTEAQAECAMKRLLALVDHWNMSTKNGFEISLTCGISAHVTGADFNDLIRSAERKLQGNREVNPLFLAYTVQGASAPKGLPV